MKWIYGLAGVLVIAVVLWVLQPEPVPQIATLDTPTSTYQQELQQPALDTNRLSPDVLNQPASVGDEPLKLSAELVESMRQDDQGLVEEIQPDGSKKVDLQGRFHQPQAATVEEDGSLRINHF